MMSAAAMSVLDRTSAGSRGNSVGSDGSFTIDDLDLSFLPDTGVDEAAAAGEDANPMYVAAAVRPARATSQGVPSASAVMLPPRPPPATVAASSADFAVRPVRQQLHPKKRARSAGAGVGNIGGGGGNGGGGGGGGGGGDSPGISEEEQEVAHLVAQLEQASFAASERPPHISNGAFEDCSGGYIYFKESPKRRRHQGQDKWLNSGGQSTARDYRFWIGEQEHMVRKRYGRINRAGAGLSQLRFREFIFLSRNKSGEITENPGTVIFQVSGTRSSCGPPAAAVAATAAVSLATPRAEEAAAGRAAGGAHPLPLPGEGVAQTVRHTLVVQPGSPAERGGGAEPQAGTQAAGSEADAAAAAAAAAGHGSILTLDGSGLDMESTPFISFLGEHSEEVGHIGRSAVGGVTMTTKSGDFAEWHVLTDEQLKRGTLSEGDVVGFVGGAITKKTKGADIVGVVSRRAAVAGSAPPVAQRWKFDTVAYTGRVPVKLHGSAMYGDVVGELS
eukprot:SAG22_NODE_79_length_21845_cov_17.798538_4_plen_502_part_00